MLSEKYFEKLAVEYRSTGSWDAKRDIIREIFSNSTKSNWKINLTNFGLLINKDLDYLYRQGQLDLYKVMQQQKKYKQNISFQTAKANLERKKNPKGRKQGKSITSIFSEEIQVGNYTKAGSSGGKYSRRDAQIYSSLNN